MTSRNQTLPTTTNPPEKQVEDFLHHAGIEGVYELGTPLVYRAILHLGSVARVVQGRAAALKGVRSGAGQAAGFELEDLELVTAVRFREKYFSTLADWWRPRRGGVGASCFTLFGVAKGNDKDRENGDPVDNWQLVTR